MATRIRSSGNVIALTVLALLTEQERHPYDIQRCIRERHKDFAEGKTRALYHAVARLEREGLIDAVDTHREGRRPERTVYRITDEGREEFQGWLVDLLETRATEFPMFNVAVSFLGYLPPAEVLRALRERATVLQVHLTVLEGVHHALRDRLQMPRIALVEHEHEHALLKAELDWVRSLAGDIEQGRLAWCDTWPPMPDGAPEVQPMA